MTKRQLGFESGAHGSASSTAKAIELPSYLLNLVREFSFAKSAKAWKNSPKVKPNPLSTTAKPIP
jgi:hypothetical protein